MSIRCTQTPSWTSKGFHELWSVRRDICDLPISFNMMTRHAYVKPSSTYIVSEQSCIEVDAEIKVDDMDERNVRPTLCVGVWYLVTPPCKNNHGRWPGIGAARGWC